MFRLATSDFHGRNVLLVEDDRQTAKMVASSVFEGGGNVVAIAPTIDGALAILAAVPIDLMVMHTRYATGDEEPVHEVLQPFQIAIMYLATLDDWFDEDDGAEIGWRRDELG